VIAPALTREYKFGFAFLDRLAMHNHVDSRKKFPVLYIRGSGETPWTVQILPYLEQGNIYHVWDITNISEYYRLGPNPAYQSQLRTSQVLEVGWGDCGFSIATLC